MTLNFHRTRLSPMLFAVAILAAGLLALLIPKPGWAAPRTFQPAPNSPIAVGSSPTTVTNADFNADSKADLAAQNSGSNSISVRLGNGDGTFQAKPDVAVGSSPTSVIGADLNDDSKTDLAVANYGSNSVSVLLGQDADGDGKADGNFVSAGNFSVDLPCGGFCIPATAGPNQVIVGNFNGDSSVDLATANIGSCGFFCTPGGVSVLLGNGNGTFQNAKLATSGAPIYFLDANGSGDVFAANYNANAVTVLRSNGNGTFSSGGSLTVGAHPSAVASEDLDGNGVEDLAVSNFDSDNVSVLWDNGSGGFQTALNFAAGDGPAFVIGARVNADEFADLAVANQNSNNVAVLLNVSGSDTTAPITTRSLSPEPNAAGWNNEDVAVTLNATDDDSGVKEISYSINGGQLTTLQQSSVQIPPITNEGETTISYSATDNAGNVEAQQTFKVKLDKSAPSAPVITSPANNSFDTDGNVTLAGRAEEGSTIEVFDGTTSKGTTLPVDSSGAWSMNLSAVGEGGHTYTAKATDVAGNTSGPGGPITVKVDTTKPTVIGTTPLNRATNVARGTNLTATFSEKMDPTTLTKSTFKLFKLNPDGTQTQVTDVVVGLSSDGLAAKLNPFGAKTTLLARNTKYKGVLTTGTKDLAGNSLAQQNSWTFTTKP